MRKRVTGLHAQTGDAKRVLLFTPFIPRSIRTRESLSAEPWATPVGTRVWTRRKPRELSSTGSLVPMYIPSVGGKYWFYFADMTTICHRVPSPSRVCTHAHGYMHALARGDSRGLTWGRGMKRIFHGRRRRGAPAESRVRSFRSARVWTTVLAAHRRVFC